MLAEHFPPVQQRKKSNKLEHLVRIAPSRSFGASSTKFLLLASSLVGFILVFGSALAQDIIHTDTLTTCRDPSCSAKHEPTPLLHDITHANTITYCDKTTCTKGAPMIITESTGTCTTSCSQLHYTVGTTIFTLVCCPTSTRPANLAVISISTTSQYKAGSAPPPEAICRIMRNLLEDC